MKIIAAFFFLSFFARAADVTRIDYDLAQTAANTAEVVLTPANVASPQFGRLGSWAVDGYVFAQAAKHFTVFSFARHANL